MINFQSLIGRDFICIFCGFPAGEVKLTKTKNLPYYQCTGCRTRCFFNSEGGVKGLVRLLEYARSVKSETFMDMAKKTGELVGQPIEGEVKPDSVKVESEVQK